MKQGQIVVIRGGWLAHDTAEYYQRLRDASYDPFATRDTWYQSCEEELQKDFDFLMPVMPNKHWVDYTAWSIWFEKTFAYLTGDKFVLIAESIGAMFVTKYLLENEMPKQIDQLHLVAPTFDRYNEYPGGDYSELQYDLALLPNLKDMANEVFVYQSTDDPSVPLDQGKKYLEHLPQAQYQEFTNRGHFFIQEFPELVESIKRLA